MLAAEIIVFSGGSSGGRRPEAEAMAAYAEHLGLPAALIKTETRASNTWENIEYSLRLVEPYDRLAIVSDALHAARARRYLLAQRPEFAARLVSAGEYRFLECLWLKLPTAAHELYVAGHSRLAAAQPCRWGTRPKL